MSASLDKSQIGIVTVDCFRGLGCEYAHGPSIAPELESYDQVVLIRWLWDALRRITSGVEELAA